MKKENEIPEKINPDELKQRVINAKKVLPHSIVSMFAAKFPEYGSYKKRSRVANVVQLRIADVEITEKIEQLVEYFKSENDG
jgi:hypothetical protein